MVPILAFMGDLQRLSVVCGGSSHILRANMWPSHVQFPALSSLPASPVSPESHYPDKLYCWVNRTLIFHHCLLIRSLFHSERQIQVYQKYKEDVGISR